MSTHGLFITRKRRWELIAESRTEAQTATRYRDGLLGAMFLMIAAVLLAVYVTS